MRHSVNIFWGKKSSESLLSLHKYMLRSSAGLVENFFRSYLYVIEGKEVHIERVIQAEDGECALSKEREFAVAKLCDEAPKFVRDTHREMITIHNKGDYSNLHLCIYVPLLEDVKQVTAFIEALEKGGFKYIDIDVVCLAGDLCNTISSEYGDAKSLLELQNISGESLKHLVQFRKKHPILQHLVAIQNYQNGGASLSLHLASLNRILGEFSLMLIEDYISVFGNVRSESDFQTIGLSMLQLDRYYFQEYMLRKSLKQIAEREKISIEQVDINMASKLADDLLRPWMTLLQDTYRSEVKVALDRCETENEIVAKIDDYLDDRFKKMREDLESYITDDKLSLPEKKAILSAILGQDDALYINELYDEDLLNFHDLEREAISQFTSTNNYILEHEDYKSEAVLSEDEEEAHYPIDEMRKNRVKLRHAMGYIRELNDEQKRLEQQMDMQEHSKDCFIGDGGFTIGERTYKLLPHFDQEPLQDQYEPHSTSVPSVDLSTKMPPVKDQGTQGACLAFSLTSVFEYMYKNMTQQTIDLSEQFLYYNAREKAGDADKDCGSYLRYAVEALAENGICVEEKWPYDTPETAFNIKPSEDAYTDALDRILAGAKNVEVKIDAIRSALSDGMPVIISARLYDSFAQAQNGFIPLPSDEERKSANTQVDRNHAMVIVGYNDEVRAFKVRNSWGTLFGLGGYAMIPYAYIEDPELIDFAAVVTEIRIAKTIADKYIIQNSLPSQVSIPRLEFDMKDTKAQYGINKILIADEQVKLRNLEEIDAELSAYCLDLKQKLKNPNLRQQMRKVAAECYTLDIEKKETELNKAYTDKSSALSDHERGGRRRFIWYGLIVLAVTILFATTAMIKSKHTGRANKYKVAIEKYEPMVEKIQQKYKADSISINLSQIEKEVGVKDPINSKLSTIAGLKLKQTHHNVVRNVMSFFCIWWVIVLTYFILGTMILLTYIRYKKEKRAIIERYDDIIDSLSSEKGRLKKALDELGIKFYLAGTMLTQFFTINDQLETKSKILESFLINAKLLSDENTKKLEELNPDVQPPFIPMLKNEELNRFYDKNSGELAVGTRLYHFFEGYAINSDAFTKFQEELRKKLNLNLDEILKEFSMYKYMSGQVAYAYLSAEQRRITDFLIDLDEKSEVFMLCNDTIALNPSKSLYLHTDPNEEMGWQSTYRRAFSSAPVCVNIDSRFKIILIRLLDLNLKQIEWYNE